MTQKTFTFPADVRFHHIRVIDNNDELSPQGGLTIAYYIDHDANRVVAALSICSPDDLFNKAEGRNLSVARLTKRIVDCEQVHDKQGRPMTVIFTGEDMSRWASQCIANDLYRLWTESIGALFKPAAAINTLSAAQTFTVDFEPTHISEYQVGLLVDKIVDFFTRQFKL